MLSKGPRPPPFFLKTALSHEGDLDSHLIHGSLGHSSPQQKGIPIGSVVFAGLTIVIDGRTDRQTKLATPSVSIGCVYVGLHNTTMQPNNNNIK